MNSLYETIIASLKNHNISYKEYDHDPILSYEDAEKEKERCGWTGIESKNVFLHGADGRYFVYVTVQGKRLDFSHLKQLLGTKVSLASEDEVRNAIFCVPGCVAPFGFPSTIITVIDPTIYTHTDYLFSPGVTTKTIQANIQDVKRIFDEASNKIVDEDRTSPL